MEATPYIILEMVSNLQFVIHLANENWQEKFTALKLEWQVSEDAECFYPVTPDP